MNVISKNRRKQRFIFKPVAEHPGARFRKCDEKPKVAGKKRHFTARLVPANHTEGTRVPSFPTNHPLSGETNEILFSL